MDTQENIDFLDLEDVAKYMGVHISSVYRFIHRDREDNPLPTFFIGEKTLRVKKTDLDGWLENFRKEGK